MTKTNKTISQIAADDTSYSGASSKGSATKIDQIMGVKTLGANQLSENNREIAANTASTVAGIQGDVIRFLIKRLRRNASLVASPLLRVSASETCCWLRGLVPYL
jgi:hypothetical protein